MFYYLTADFKADLSYQSQDVSIRRVAGRSQDKVGGGQSVKVGNVRVNHMGAVEQLSKLLGC